MAAGHPASLNAIAVAEAGPFANNYYSNQSPGADPDAHADARAGRNARPGRHRSAQRRREQRVPRPDGRCADGRQQGVRIYTVGIGSAAGTTLNLDGFQVHTQLDAATLQQISQLTGGTYYGATDAQQLLSIYDNLDTQLVVQPQDDGDHFARSPGLGLLLLVAGGLTSLIWLGRLP